MIHNGVKQIRWNLKLKILADKWHIGVKGEGVSRGYIFKIPPYYLVIAVLLY